MKIKKKEFKVTLQSVISCLMTEASDATTNLFWLCDTSSGICGSQDGASVWRRINFFYWVWVNPHTAQQLVFFVYQLP